MFKVIDPITQASITFRFEDGWLKTVDSCHGETGWEFDGEETRALLKFLQDGIQQSPQVD
jgi:hypothetical protein